MQYTNAPIDLEQPGLIFSVYERLTGFSAFGYRCADGSRIVRCPASGHEDRHPSCKINPRINAWKCFACSAQGGIIAMVVAARKHEGQVGCKSAEHGAMLWLEQALGASPQRILQAQPLPKRAKPKSGALADEHEAGTYDYRNVAGDVILRVVRIEGTGEGGERAKRFEAMRPDGKGGWIHNARGAEILPYRLPQLLAAARAGRIIILVEGERDADALSSLDLCATSAPFGASFSLPQGWKTVFRRRGGAGHHPRCRRARTTRGGQAG